MTTTYLTKALDICETLGIHQEVINDVQGKIPDFKQLYALAELFKLFADSTRVSILWALSESELCVCDICALLKMKQSAISHQLKKLKLSRIVKSRRDGKIIFYSLDDAHIRMLLDLGMEHAMEAYDREDLQHE